MPRPEYFFLRGEDKEDYRTETRHEYIWDDKGVVEHCDK